MLCVVLGVDRGVLSVDTWHYTTLHVLKVSKSVSESVSENNGEFVSLYKKFQFSMSLDNSWSS